MIPVAVDSVFIDGQRRDRCLRYRAMHGDRGVDQLQLQPQSATAQRTKRDAPAVERRAAADLPTTNRARVSAVGLGLPQLPARNAIRAFPNAFADVSGKSGL